MFPLFSNQPIRRKRFLVGVCALTVSAFVVLGIFARNGWLPSTDPISGKKTGWFGKPLATSASSSWNPSAPPVPEPTPQLSKEYIYAGSRLLAVVDSNAQEAPPTDLAIWRPSTGTWWVLGGPGSGQVAQQWGLSTDKPVPGDYDGDGKTDFSVFRPGQTSNDSGQWYVLRSSDGSWDPVISWGVNADKFVQADYDGDGRTDRAVWRESDGTWYVISSSTGSAAYYTYGMSGDIPAPADYDGDGKADLAVWRNSDQKFHWTNSSNNTSTSLAMNQSSVEPVCADYDGDGKADHAIRNGSNWIIRRSSDQQIETVPWQQNTDTAVQNDYDGDGKCDLAVWRPVDSPTGTVGKWYIRQSAFNNSERVVQWGIVGDIPVAAFYRR